MPTLIATIGGTTSNSYETHAEANTYFDERLPIVPPWVASGEESVLIMATRTLDALAQPFKTFFPGDKPYYIIRRQWTGSPATIAQQLAWPRVGMVDQNNNPLDWTISGITVDGTAAVVTTTVPHRFATGQTVLIANTDSTPVIDGERIVTVLSTTTFSVPVVTTVAGTTGAIYIIPQALKDAESELAGQLLAGDRTLDNDVIIQGITSLRAGPVSLSFKNDIRTQVIPDAVYNLMPQSWLTAEVYELAGPNAQFDVVSL